MRVWREGPADGGVAQLGEHLLCKQGVIGSNPFTSTSRIRDGILSAAIEALPRFCRVDEVFGWRARGCRSSQRRKSIGVDRPTGQKPALICPHRVATRACVVMRALCQCKSGSGASVDASIWQVSDLLRERSCRKPYRMHHRRRVCGIARCRARFAWWQHRAVCVTPVGSYEASLKVDVSLSASEGCEALAWR